MGKKDKPVPAPPAAAAPPPEQFDMVFHCQLAHGSPTRQIRDFTNVKQLYESIAKAFGIKTNEVRSEAKSVFLLFFFASILISEDFVLHLEHPQSRHVTPVGRSNRS